MISPFLRRLLRFCLWSIAILVTLYALLCVWMNWAGSRALDRTLARLKSEGETLDYKALQAPTVDPAKNFFAIEPLKDLALVIDNDASKGEPGEKRKALDAMKLTATQGNELNPWFGDGARLGRSKDLSEMANWLRESKAISMPEASGKDAEDLRQAFEQAFPLLKDLAAAATQHPEAQFTPNLRDRELPENPLMLPMLHYYSVQQVVRLLPPHGRACLELGDTAAAMADLHVMLHCVNACQDESFLIGLLVAANSDAQAKGLIWEALRSGRLTESQLAKLQSSLERINYREATLRALRGEMVFASRTMNFLETRGASELFKFAFNSGTKGDVSTQLWDIAPRGLVRWNLGTLLETEMDGLILPMKRGGLPELLHSCEHLDAMLKDLKRHPVLRFDALLAWTSVPASLRLAEKITGAESQHRHAIIACALERYFLQHKAYPAALTELVPQFLSAIPTDVMDGKPMRYRQTDKGRYVIWATGFDGKDDGGKVNLSAAEKSHKRVQVSTTEKREPRLYDREYVGDWAWQYEPVD